MIIHTNSLFPFSYFTTLSELNSKIKFKNSVNCFCINKDTIFDLNSVIRDGNSGKYISNNIVSNTSIVPGENNKNIVSHYNNDINNNFYLYTSLYNTCF